MHPDTVNQGQQKAPSSDVSRMTTLKELAREYWANRPMELAAALSYYTLLSLAPLVLMAVAVAGLIFERAAVEGKIVTEIRLLVGVEGSEVVQTVLRHASDPEKSAHSVVIRHCRAPPRRDHGLRTASKLSESHLESRREDARKHVVGPGEGAAPLVMVLAVGFLLLVSLLVSAAVAAVGETTWGGLSDAGRRARGTQCAGLAGRRHAAVRDDLQGHAGAPVAWRDVWIGAIITAVLFTIRQEPDRAVPRPHEHRVALRGGGFARGHDRVGVLRVDDRLFRRGAYVLSFQAPAGGEPSVCPKTSLLPCSPTPVLACAAWIPTLVIWHADDTSRASRANQCDQYGGAVE